MLRDGRFLRSLLKNLRVQRTCSSPTPPSHVKVRLPILLPSYPPPPLPHPHPLPLTHPTIPHSHPLTPPTDSIFFANEFPAMKSSGKVDQIKRMTFQLNGVEKPEDVTRLWWKKGDADPVTKEGVRCVDKEFCH